MKYSKEYLRKRYPQRNPPKLTAYQKVGHFFLVAGGWGWFAWMWMNVQATSSDISGIVLLLALTFITAPVITALWVFYNMRIYKQKGPRLGSRSVESIYSVDWAGREITADWEALKKSKIVVIEVDEFGKLYRTASSK